MRTDLLGILVLVTGLLYFPTAWSDTPATSVAPATTTGAEPGSPPKNAPQSIPPVTIPEPNQATEPENHTPEPQAADDDWGEWNEPGTSGDSGFGVGINDADVRELNNLDHSNLLDYQSETILEEQDTVLDSAIEHSQQDAVVQQVQRQMLRQLQNPERHMRDQMVDEMENHLDIMEGTVDDTMGSHIDDAMLQQLNNEFGEEVIKELVEEYGDEVIDELFDEPDAFYH